MAPSRVKNTDAARASNSSKDPEGGPCLVRFHGSTEGVSGSSGLGEGQNQAEPSLSHHEAAHEKRFWSHVEKTLTCWLWLGAKTRGGYGSCGDPWNPGKTMLAHRRSWRAVNGPVPGGLQLDHICRVRNCVRPEHLDLVTGWENTLRGNNHVAANARKTHCLRGHALSGPNLRVTPAGRVCRACSNGSNRRKRAEKRAWLREVRAQIRPEHAEARP